MLDARFWYYLYLVVFIAATSLFTLLLIRIFAALVKLDPYHPLIQFLYRFTEHMVAPFRFGVFRRPSTVDLAVIPPMFVLLMIILITGSRL